MIKYFLILISVIFFSFIASESFKNTQIKYTRVQTAYAEKENTLRVLYKEKKVDFCTQQIFLRIFKEEQELELWARSCSNEKFKLIKTYTVVSSSGRLGPKRKQGDRQVPEGFYHIDRFNPQSSFYLSLGINYPNASDKILGDQNPGGDIFIHGNCVSIGCTPITDDKIKEVYLLAIEAKNNGQNKIPVNIFPCRMNEENFNLLKSKHSENKTLVNFWNNIKKGYDFFELNKKLPKVCVEADGKYRFE